MQGKRIRLSAARLFIGDLLRAAVSIPTVPVQRRMVLGELAAARTAHRERPSWSAMFTKAYARVVAATPALRRAYVKFPWPHLYEYPITVASIAVEREYQGEKAVFIARLRQPDQLPLLDVNRSIRHLKETPIDQVKDFRRALRVSRAPWPIRRLL